MLFKTCVSCFNEFPKSPDFFYRKAGTKNGFKSKCINCWKKQNNRYYRFNQEKHQSVVKAYKERLKKCKSSSGDDNNIG